MDILFWWFALVNHPLPAVLRLVNMSGVLIGISAMIVGGLAHQSVGHHQPETLGWETALKHESASVAIFFIGLALFLFGVVWTACLAVILLPVYLYIRRKKLLTE